MTRLASRWYLTGYGIITATFLLSIHGQERPVDADSRGYIL